MAKYKSRRAQTSETTASPRGGESDLPSWLHPEGEDLRLEVTVAPRSSHDRVMGTHDDRLKIQLRAPPVDNKANHALIAFVADSLNVPKVQIELISGATNKRKSIRLLRVSVSQALLCLSPPIAHTR